MSISIRVRHRETVYLDLDQLDPSLQGNLKILEADAFEQFKRELLDVGFTEPFTVWDRNGKKYPILNGVRRYQVLTVCRQEGIEVPPLPCNLVQADSEQEAVLMAVGLAAQYGKVVDEGLYELMSRHKIPVSHIESRFRIPEIDMPKFKANFFTEPTDMPELPSGDRGSLRQMAFQLTEDQVNIVSDAIRIAKEQGDFEETGSSNSNGNAIHRISLWYLRENGQG
jgi:hypothetical protein